MSDVFRFKGGVAVVTGAARGIGSGLVKTALKEGMKVVAADVQEGALKAFAQSLGPDVMPIALDVTDPAAVDALAERTYDMFGRVDLLFNNAGVLAAGLSWEIEPERWKKSFDVNVMGVINGTRSFVPRMLKQGRPAHIINTASVGGFLASPLLAPYSATKFAVVALTEALRGELEIVEAQIGVSVLAPGPVDTGIFNDPFGAHQNDAVTRYIAHMRKLLTEQGLAPDAFGPRVFDGIQKQLFWIIPQPEHLDKPLQRKTDDIIARRTPRVPRF